jgi:hypothetical protein
MSISNGASADKMMLAIGSNIVPVLNVENMEGLEVWLEVLFANRVSSVLMRLAENSHTPATLLNSLANQDDSDLRIAVSENPSCPRTVLDQLICDHDPDVRYALAENHNLPVEVIRQLTQDENPYVACRALRTLDRLQGFSLLRLTSLPGMERRVAT